MKKLFILLIAALACMSLSAQTLKECVYLKNGSVIKGIIIEQVPNVSLKIQTADGSIFVYEMDQVEKITKEAVSVGFSSPAVSLLPKDLGNMHAEYKSHKMLIMDGDNIIKSMSYKSDRFEMREYMGETAFRRYESGRAMEISGIVLTSVGALSSILGIAFLPNRNWEVMFSGVFLTSIGSVVVATGVPLWVCGPLVQKKAVYSCNQRSTNQYSLQLYPSAQSMGTSLTTGKNDVAFGATLAFRF